ncbi:MAG TPA: hypothetical protein VMT88_13570, partial [Actinomycetes bacterium]|nr:hypothetical protein [Actinomycetes bacterium]
SEFAIYGSTCTFDGNWRATSTGLFTAYAYGGSGDCPDEWPRLVVDVSKVQRFATGLEPPQLLDVKGDVVIPLNLPGDVASWPQSAQDAQGDENSLLRQATGKPSGEGRDWLQSGFKPLPSSMSPGVDNLVGGRWYPQQTLNAGQHWSDHPYVEFAADGGWSGPMAATALAAGGLGTPKPASSLRRLALAL